MEIDPTGVILPVLLLAGLGVAIGLGARRYDEEEAKNPRPSSPSIKDRVHSALTRDRRIIGRSGVAHYSVADEVQKWKTLLDGGVVTQQEYDDARAALLGRKP